MMDKRRTIAFKLNPDVNQTDKIVCETRLENDYWWNPCYYGNIVWFRADCSGRSFTYECNLTGGEKL